ncbi:hypothetical protein EZS27_010010 [termite gut metagenome]|uniref:DUF2158 domain-containing protein n=1 Tax=termite gut metagenome TaxID=433724 RepID=A0A5J4S951_9ZZZZ
METEQEFKVGDLVILKSSTSKFSMTVESILEDGRIECVWHDDKCTPYKPIVLVHYKDNEPKQRDKSLGISGMIRR